VILYQVAMRMEQHARLKQSIRESSGDVSCLMDEKVEIEQQMLSQASLWNDEKSVFVANGAEGFTRLKL
jgi:hypothetical protein